MNQLIIQPDDIVNVNLGSPPKEIVGHEQAYERPCLIINSFIKLGLSVIIPCTSKKPKVWYYTIVFLPKGSGGLKIDSYVLCHQIRTISMDRIKGKFGKFGSRDFLKVKAVLQDTLDL